MNLLHIAALVKSMTSQEEKTQQVEYLLSAQMKPPHFSNIIGMSWSIMFAIKQVSVKWDNFFLSVLSFFKENISPILFIMNPYRGLGICVTIYQSSFVQYLYISLFLKKNKGVAKVTPHCGYTYDFF